jgi:hypothetical protein
MNYLIYAYGAVLLVLVIATLVTVRKLYRELVAWRNAC